MFVVYCEKMWKSLSGVKTLKQIIVTFHSPDELNGLIYSIFWGSG